MEEKTAPKIHLELELVTKEKEAENKSECGPDTCPWVDCEVR